MEERISDVGTSCRGTFIVEIRLGHRKGEMCSEGKGGGVCVVPHEMGFYPCLD